MPLFAVVCPDVQKARHPVLDSAGVVRDVEKVDFALRAAEIQAILIDPIVGVDLCLGNDSSVADRIPGLGVRVASADRIAKPPRSLLPRSYATPPADCGQTAECS
jgi:hypothetical protein